jgi:Tetratricopeptide repeat
MSKSKLSRNPLRQIWVIVSAVFFLGSIGISTWQLYAKSFSSPSSPIPSQESSLTAEAQGYETVLQREPDNQTALEGLANARIEMQDFSAAIEPLEKLVKLYPDRTDYQAKLVKVKEKVGNR